MLKGLVADQSQCTLIGHTLSPSLSSAIVTCYILKSSTPKVVIEMSPQWLCHSALNCPLSPSVYFLFCIKNPTKSWYKPWLLEREIISTQHPTLSPKCKLSSNCFMSFYITTQTYLLPVIFSIILYILVLIVPYVSKVLLLLVFVFNFVLKCYSKYLLSVLIVSCLSAFQLQICF